MTRFVLVEDARARAFEPFALTRPVAELRAGAELIRQRWERVTALECAGFAGPPHLADFDEPGAAGALHSDAKVPAGTVVANSRFVPALDQSVAAAAIMEGAALTCAGRACAVKTAREVSVGELSEEAFELESFAPNGGTGTIGGRWLEHVWDLVDMLPVQLAEDIMALGRQVNGDARADAVVLGDFPVFCESGALIEPHVVLDASAGPILIRSGATIAAFSRIVGPCYVGEHATIVGDAIRVCSIGDWCKVRGEMSNSVMLAYSNKSHTGFVGHSYLGRWVNLGAGTTTSNLKNTYGSVHMWTPAGVTDTGVQLLGTLFGDHVKTGIGMLLTTGSVLGAGANIFGSAGTPKYVPPFSWGASEPYSVYEAGKFLEVATRMMARRAQELTERAARQLAAAYRKGTHNK